MQRVALLAVLMAMLGGQAAMAAGGPTTIWVPRLEEQGRLLVEMRVTMEQLGYAITWTPAEERVDAVRGDLTVTMWMDEPEALVNGESVMLDVPPRLMWDRTFVPLRFVAETVGAEVEYRGDTVLVVGPMGDLVFRFYEQ